MNGLLLHDKTKARLKTLLNRPPHSLLVIGADGSGKQHLARHISAALQSIPANKLENQPYYIRLQKPKDKQEIPIDDIRQMIRRLATKTAGHVRVVHIEQAQLLSEESQNALLKSIEEPPVHTHFILSTPAVSLLLPTIVSRSQKVIIQPVGLEAAQEYFGQQYDSRKIAAAWNLSRGGAGLMSALLNDDDGHPLKAALEQAKSFIKMDKYDRALFLDRLNPDKAGYLLFLDALDRLLAALAASSIRSGKSSQTRRIISSRRLVGKAIESVALNVSPRLVGLCLAQRLTV